MNNLFHELNKYEGWEKYWEQSSITGRANPTFSFIRCKIFCDETLCFGWKKKVSVEFELTINMHDRVSDDEILRKKANAAHKTGVKWKDEIMEWVNESDIDSKGSMIELAEMALVSSDPYVKDAFITKWLAKVKPIK